MLPALAISIVIISPIDVPQSDWDRVKSVLDKKLDDKRGVGLIISIEHTSEDTITINAIERGSSNSAWTLNFIPIDVKSGT